MATTVPPTPTNDIALAYGPPPAGSGVVGTVGFALDHGGQARTVADADRAIQDARLFLTLAQGAWFADPADGNALYGAVGLPSTPGTPLATHAGDMLQQAEAAFLQRQIGEVASGYLGLGAQVQSLTLDSAALTPAGIIDLGVTATTATGATVGADALFGVGGNGGNGGG